MTEIFIRNTIVFIFFSIATFLAACSNSASNQNNDQQKSDTTTTVNADYKPSLNLVFSDSTYHPTGVAVSKNGRLFTNYPL